MPEKHIPMPNSLTWSKSKDAARVHRQYQMILGRQSLPVSKDWLSTALHYCNLSGPAGLAIRRMIALSQGYELNTAHVLIRYLSTLFKSSY